MFENFLSGPEDLLAALQTPEGKRALLSFGINMMQPIPVGQSPMGQIGESVGAGVDTYDAAKKAQAEETKARTSEEQRNRELDIQQRKAEEAASPKLSLGQLLSRQDKEAQRQAKELRDYQDFIVRQAQDEARNTISSTPVDPNTLLADPANIKRYQELWKTRQGLKPPESTTPSPTTPSTGGGVPTAEGGTATPQPLSSKVSASNATFKNWVNQFPDRWTNLRLALYSSNPQQKAWAIQELQKLRNVIVDPQELDRQLSQDHG